jgi:hypothetical protein
MKLESNFEMKELTVNTILSLPPVSSIGRTKTIGMCDVAKTSKMKLSLFFLSLNRVSSRDLMTFTENMLCTLAVECTGSPVIRWKDKENDQEHLIDLTPPYKKIDIWPELERCVGPLPHPSTLFSSG